MNPEISVVVPLHNEGPNVVPLVCQIVKALKADARPIELLLVDDCSSDDTWEQIQLASKDNPQVRGFRHLANAGQSAALWTGFCASRGQAIATLDGDLQNDPADLPRLLELLATCDMACGVRLARKDNALRRLSSRVARAARRLVLRVDFRDTGCNLRAFKRSLLSKLPPFNGLHRFMPILAHGAGAAVKEIPVAHHPRVAGRSHYGIWNRLGRGVLDLMMVALLLRRQLKAVTVIERPSDQPDLKR